MGMTLRLTLISALISLALVGCTSKTSAPIRQASSVNAETNRTTLTDKAPPVTSSSTTRATGWTPIPDLPETISDNANSNSAAVNNRRTADTVPTNYTNTSATNSAVNNSSGVSAIPNRDYSEIPKGSFSGDLYTVKRGDTLFYIAWITGNDYRTLAAKNNIIEPFYLTVGQTLNVANGVNNTPQVVSTTAANRTGSQSSQNNQSAGNVKPAKGTSSTTPIFSNDNASKRTGSTTQTVSTNTGISASGTTTVGSSTSNNSISGTSNGASANIIWRWPAEGKIIDGFSSSGGGNKGIDLAGSRGQSIVSAADGRVVYAGNALRGYGNLIIIKHNDDYLSAYAHNDSMLVSEQQDVKAGQKIATMGSSGASSVRLHFEVRYKGKSVNPLHYLPQR